MIKTINKNELDIISTIDYTIYLHLFTMAASAANNVQPDPIVSLMACMMNYLNVSLYEGLFTYNHEQARATLNDIYDSVSKTPLILYYNLSMAK